MLWKCCPQYASKFGKLSSGHRTGKGQFSFQSQRRAMPKNVQTTIQLHSFHLLIRLCSKFFKLGFRQYVNWDFPNIQAGLRKGRGICWIMEKPREFQKNTYFCFIDCAKAFDHEDHNKLWKILKEMGISDHLTCLLRNLYAGQEAIVRTRQGIMDWFQIGKGVHQGCILLACLFNLCAEHIMWNARLDELQAGIKTSGKNINNLRYADDTTLMAESEEELKASWWKRRVKELA